MPCFITSTRVILSLHQPHFLLVSCTHPIGFECPHPPPRLYKGPTCHLSYVYQLFLYLFFFPWIKSNHYFSRVHCNKNPPQKGSFWTGSKAAYHDLSQTPQKWELCALWEWSKSCLGNFQHYPKNSYWNSQRIQKYITQFLDTFIFHTRTTNPTFTKFKKKLRFPILTYNQDPNAKVKTETNNTKTDIFTCVHPWSQSSALALPS